MAELTPGQTVGPFFGCGLPYPGDNRLVDDAHPDAVRLHGTVFDGAGTGVPDALLELWQPDAGGHIARRSGSLHRDGTFTGFGRTATDAAGRYSFTTLAPGGQRPFFAITVFARGLLNALFTRGYLPGGDLDREPLLAGLDAARRETLLCVADPSGYRFDVRLQGPKETVFLEFDGR